MSLSNVNDILDGNIDKFLEKSLTLVIFVEIIVDFFGFQLKVVKFRFI